MKKRYIVLVIVMIVALWSASWYFIPKWYDEPPLQAGTFGDMFGAVNALFSGLAFAGLIYTISVQRQELKEQQKAIRMQTEELSLQSRALEMQNEELKILHEETARSADQLEIQRQLMNYQLVLATVNDLIKLKNNKIDILNMTIRNNTKIGMDVIEGVAKYWTSETLETLEEHKLKQLKRYSESCFFLFQFILDTDLIEYQKENLKKIVKVNTSNEEVIVLQNLAHAEYNQHHLFLMKTFQLI